MVIVWKQIARSKISGVAVREPRSEAGRPSSLAWELIPSIGHPVGRHFRYVNAGGPFKISVTEVVAGRSQFRAR